MDIISHGLYAGIAFGRKQKREYITAFLFGILPDLIAFGPYFLSMFLGIAAGPTGDFDNPKAIIVPNYVHAIYNVSHSLVIYAIFFALLWLLAKKSFAKLTFGWPLHILVDIPLHSLQFFPTPFLWPISNFHIDGTSWGNPYIFFPNLAFIVIIYTYWYFKNKKAKLN